MLKQVICSTVDGFCGYDMVACLRKILNGISYRSGARSNTESGNSTFKSGNSPLKNILSGVCEPSVYIAGISKAKTGGGMS